MDAVPSGQTDIPEGEPPESTERTRTLRQLPDAECAPGLHSKEEQRQGALAGPGWPEHLGSSGRASGGRGGPTTSQRAGSAGLEQGVQRPQQKDSSERPRGEGGRLSHQTPLLCPVVGAADWQSRCENAQFWES